MFRPLALRICPYLQQEYLTKLNNIECSIEILHCRLFQIRRYQISMMVRSCYLTSVTFRISIRSDAQLGQNCHHALARVQTNTHILGLRYYKVMQRDSCVICNECWMEGERPPLGYPSALEIQCPPPSPI